MDRLRKVGTVKPRSSSEIRRSRLGIGFEKLDRDVFDPEKAYDKVAATGVKWIRLQSGWARTEKQRGVYDFRWLDGIVDNLIGRGLTPWLCLCYGNGLYDEEAAKVFGAVGCPPVRTAEQKKAWHNYVKATAEHYRGRITHYEVWNEPDDGTWMWRPAQNGIEVGEFTIATAKAVREADPDAKLIGGAVTAPEIAFLNEAFQTGMGDYIDYISFHEYTSVEIDVFERVKTLQALARRYNPRIGVIQGESGSQSRRGGNGALSEGAWTEEKQAKQLARHTMADLMTGVLFTSYFSCMDMVEALCGEEGNVATYLDYGYFGVLGADFDENGRSVGTYTPKPSYYALQTIAALFSDDCEYREMPIILLPQESPGIMYRWRYYGKDEARHQIISGGFVKPHGEAFVYWKPSDIMTTTFSGTISGQVQSPYEQVQLIDLMDGSVYDIPQGMISRDPYGVFTFTNLPVKDTPLALSFGDFMEDGK